MTDVHPFQLIIRCFVEPCRDQWQAFSLELGLAAQADSMTEAKQKLDAMIECYVADALTGQDRGHAYELLNRKATWRVYTRYYLYWLMPHLLARHSADARKASIYREPLPLEPRHRPA